MKCGLFPRHLKFFVATSNSNGADLNTADTENFFLADVTARYLITADDDINPGDIVVTQVYFGTGNPQVRPNTIVKSGEDVGFLTS